MALRLLTRPEERRALVVPGFQLLLHPTVASVINFFHECLSMLMSKFLRRLDGFTSYTICAFESKSISTGLLEGRYLLGRYF